MMAQINSKTSALTISMIFKSVLIPEERVQTPEIHLLHNVVEATLFRFQVKAFHCPVTA